MDPVNAFSPDYATARRRFRDAAARLGWHQETLPIDAGGPEGEELTIDVGISPGPADAPALVLSSGLHGVEGFLGSAAQLALLDGWAHAPLPPVRCVFLHALNPFAFAWLRRCDENNVDLNRNFLLESEPYAGSPERYARLDPMLNRRRPPSRWEPFALKAALALLRYGMPTLKQVIAGGQYEFPKGLFYGGAGPSLVHRLLARHLDRWLGAAPRVVHFDFHTGLGPWGEGKLLIGYPLSPARRSQLTRWFGPRSFVQCSDGGQLYRTRGDLGQWCVARNPGRDYHFACAEFGTYGPFGVLSALRTENQAHHYGKPNDRATLRAKRRFLETFCPASPRWRRTVIEQSLTFARQAIAGLTEAAPVSRSLVEAEAAGVAATL